MEAATQEPDKVANFVVLALHDRLNRDGTEVTNGAGDGTWELTGDEYLNPKSLEIMRKAVQQSVDNIGDPSILAGKLDFEPYFERVWRSVPRPTATSKTLLTSLVREYTNPASVVLSTAAAEIIRERVNSLISVLLAKGKLKKA